jgi:hypothetical protein
MQKETSFALGPTRAREDSRFAARDCGNIPLRTQSP